MRHSFWIVIFSLTLALAYSTQAKTITITAADSFKKAVESASENDTIIVTAGIYRENEIEINKRITIIGQGFPVIDGESKSWVISVRASGVTIAGLTIKSSAVSFIQDNAGLLLEDVHDCTIVNNRFVNNFFAIYLAKSYNCRIANNTIESSALSEPSSGNGIHLWYCRDIVIENNSITGHRDGLYFEFVKHSTITRNTSYKNLRYGLHFMFSDSCNYSRNWFYENGAGVAVMYTYFVRMTENRFERNWGPSSYGLLLKDITDSKIDNNYIYKNSVGLYAEACNRLTVTNNEFIENGWAVKIMSNSLDNKFSKNNFIGNSFQVSTNGRQNFSTFDNNYWSNYRGYDLDRDGFGDVPFRPVSLFSIVVEKEPATLILLRSLLIETFDLIERLIPSLTPETLIDNKPAMRPFK